MSAIQFIQITPEDLQERITTEIKVILKDFLLNFKPSLHDDYLTRKQVAELLDIDLSTLNNWCKSGKLKPLGIGKRVYFLRSEIENCMIRLRG